MDCTLIGFQVNRGIYYKTVKIFTPLVGKTRMYCGQKKRYYEIMDSLQTSTDATAPEKGVFLLVNRQMIPIVKKVTTLGRQLDNDIAFHEEFVSRFHAEIVFENPNYVLYDKQSTSGTFVNGKKVDRCVLNSGDLISLANIFLMFVNNNPRIVVKSTGTTQSLRTPEYQKEER